MSGVPKEGAKALKTLEDFTNDFVFDFEFTNKNLIVYNDFQDPFELIDYEGKKYTVTDKYGICLLPTTYKLGIAEEYFNLISDESSKHAKFIE